MVHRYVEAAVTSSQWPLRRMAAVVSSRSCYIQSPQLRSILYLKVPMVSILTEPLALDPKPQIAQINRIWVLWRPERWSIGFVLKDNAAST